MWIIFKNFIESATTLLLVHVWFLAERQVGSQLPGQGLNHTPCTERRSVHPWITSEVPQNHLGAAQ